MWWLDTEEKSERFHELKSKGYDLDTTEQKVCDILDMEPGEIYSKSHRKITAGAKGLHRYWAVRKLSIHRRIRPQTNSSRVFGRVPMK